MIVLVASMHGHTKPEPDKCGDLRDGLPCGKGRMQITRDRPGGRHSNDWLHTLMAVLFQFRQPARLAAYS